MIPIVRRDPRSGRTVLGGNVGANAASTTWVFHTATIEVVQP